MSEIKYPKYEVGDKVIIVPELTEDMPESIDVDMTEFQGKVVTIKKVLEDTSKDHEEKWGESYIYNIEEDDGFFSWTSPMILSYASDFDRYSATGVIVTRDGTEFVRIGQSYMSANGIEIPVVDYEKNKHKDASDADIVKIYGRKEDSNYIFDKGDLVWSEEE